MRLFILLVCLVLEYNHVISTELEHKSSKIHQVFVAPPKHFPVHSDKKHEGGFVSNIEKGAFYRDAVRDQELFGLSPSASTEHQTVYRRQNRRKYDKLISTEDRKVKYKPLNSFKKPKYSKIERSSEYNSVEESQTRPTGGSVRDKDRFRHINPQNKYPARTSEYQPIQSKSPKDEKTKQFIDASRFDYDIGNYDYIDDEIGNDLNDFVDYYEDEPYDTGSKDADVINFKRKYLENKLPYLDLDQTDRRNIRIHIPSKSSAQITTKRPRKKIIIRRFKKSSPVTPKISRRSKRHKKTGLTPAERYYLEHRPERSGTLRARSVADSQEGESHNSLHGHLSHHHPLHGHHYSDQGLHGHDLQGAVVRGVSGLSPGNFEEPKKIQFQIHGQGGPRSYRFGHDTGIGYNRQFRYEERDDYGHVKGRYGYYDQTGDLKIVNYSADPQTGYHVDIQQTPPG